MPLDLLYSNGSSTTYGLDLVKPKGAEGTFESYRLANTYTAFVANRLGIKNVLNSAKPGSSIESLTRRTQFDLLQLSKEQTKTLALIALPPATPTEIFLRSEKKYVNIMLPEPHMLKFKKLDGIPTYYHEAQTEYHKLYTEKILSLDYILDKYFTHLVGLMSFLEKLNISYLMFHTAPIIYCRVDENTGQIFSEENGDLDLNRSLIEKYINQQGLQSFLKAGKIIDFNQSSIIEYCVEQNHVRLGKTGHMLEDGHKLWAQKLIDVLPRY